jgi:lipopolysaccharide/colanic/teichoic acid biosynthesis glycosyltransferase
LRPFRIYKFRTMRVEHSDEAGGAGFAGADDPRITGIGRLLRGSHLDELPQLINIVLGEMSLVGPRPEPLEFARRMAAQVYLYEQRYLVRPGLTGYAQINQGYAMDSVAATKVKLSFDIYYVCHRSLLMDFAIMARTLPHLFRSRPS